jgi:tRNA (guanine-N7-)-methyltransferase
MSGNVNRLIYSFSRRRGKALLPNAKRLVRELLPTLEMDVKDVDLRALFHNAKSVRMEIGFGAGEHLAAQARHNPDIGYIGCEPFINGVAKLLQVIDEENLRNIRLFTDDARLLCAELPDDCLERIDILFPDPWRKPRHYKRRLISLETLALLARLQPEGAELRLATDHLDYSAWMLEMLHQSPHYDWQAECADDWRVPPSDWEQTRYQRKTSAEGRAPVFLIAKRTGFLSPNT